MIEIKSISGRVLYTAEHAQDVRAAVKEAVAKGADLRGADLRGADLRGADLQGAYLQGAYLRGAYLRGAYLRGADLQGAYLQGAYLQGADLRGADLRGADLRGADLQGADLRGADLRGAYLQGAYLQGADLQGAYLRGAKGAELAIAQTRILPEVGSSIIGWKKCSGGVIVKLRIPKNAKRSHAFGRKCRAEYAKVLEVIGSDDGIGRSMRDRHFEYRAGETVRPNGRFDEDWMEECAPGIHFFTTRAEAEDYVL